MIFLLYLICSNASARSPTAASPAASARSGWFRESGGRFLVDLIIAALDVYSPAIHQGPGHTVARAWASTRLKVGLEIPI